MTAKEAWKEFDPMGLVNLTKFQEQRVVSAMKFYAEQARKEERERLEKEIKYYRTTLADIAGMSAESYGSGGDYRNTLAHIQTDASWALSEYDKNETEGK